jgi:hypothetical protein
VALRFFFNVTLERADVAKHRRSCMSRAKMPVMLSPEEVVHAEPAQAENP